MGYFNKRIFSDKELIRICSSFRIGVLGTRGNSRDKCYMVTAPLYSYLKFLKFDCEMVEGFVTVGSMITNHFWILLPDGRIVDATADQFNLIKGEQMPKVYVGEKPSWYMKKKEKKTV